MAEAVPQLNCISAVVADVSVTEVVCVSDCRDVVPVSAAEVVTGSVFVVETADVSMGSVCVREEPVVEIGSVLVVEPAVTMTGSVCVVVTAVEMDGSVFVVVMPETEVIVGTVDEVTATVVRTVVASVSVLVNGHG